MDDEGNLSSKQLEEEQISEQPAKADRKNYLGLNYDKIDNMGTNIPGFKMIKDTVIKPLIVATEKVVEYYLDPQEKEAGGKALEKEMTDD